jgi:RNA polymerase sigma-70 factor (ECF subfamily)
VSLETDDPAAIVASRESLRLALIASLQYLPGRQRAVLLLRDVLAFPAAEATPLRTWFAGRKTCVPYLVAHVLGSARDWRVVPTSANGQPAAVGYYRGSDGAYLPYGVVVLTASSRGIAHVHAFGDPSLVTRFEHLYTV